MTLITAHHAASLPRPGAGRPKLTHVFWEDPAPSHGAHAAGGSGERAAVVTDVTDACLVKR